MVEISARFLHEYGTLDMIKVTVAVSSRLALALLFPLLEDHGTPVVFFFFYVVEWFPRFLAMAAVSMRGWVPDNPQTAPSLCGS